MKIADMAIDPRTDGRQLHVIVPPFALVTDIDLHPGIVLPAAEKETVPLVLTDTDKVVLDLNEAVLGKLVAVIDGGVHAER
jgi:hypothetical protein